MSTIRPIAPTTPRAPAVPRARLLAGLIAGLIAGGCAPGPEPRALTAMSDADPGASDVVVTLDRWTFDRAEGLRITTPSFRIYTTLPADDLRDRLPAFLELVLAEYQSALADLPKPERVLDTYVMASRGQWSRLTQRLMGDQAPTYLRIQRGGFSDDGRGVFFNIGLEDTLSVAAHEGWHQYTQAVFRDPLPIWLEEGIACYFEGFTWDPTAPRRPLFMPWANQERYDQLVKAARAGRLMPLERLLRVRPQDMIRYSSERTLDYYAQIWALVHFLREADDGARAEALAELVTDAQAGRLLQRIRAESGGRAARFAATRRTGAAALLLYLDEPDLLSVNAAYLAYVRRITSDDAAARIERGRSPGV